MKVLPFYKDIILHYAEKVNTNKGDENVIEELDKKLIKDVNELRDRFPQLLFVNYDSKIDEQTADNLFMSIKEIVKGKYSIKYVPDTMFVVDEVCGKRIETPGILQIEDEGYICVFYENLELKKRLLNQLVFSLILQLPIKKIEFTFVDLQETYIEELIIHHFNPILYRNKPITSVLLLEELITRLEKRRLEVMQQYGDYQKYCEKTKTIPIPYEFVVLLDEFYDDKYQTIFNRMIRTGYKYGVYVILFKKTDCFRIPNNIVLDPNGKQIYYHLVRRDAQYDNNKIYQSGTFFIKTKETDNCFDKPKSLLADSRKDDDYIARGYGDFDVVLTKKLMPPNTPTNFVEEDKVQSIFNKEIGISQYRLREVLTNNTCIILASFPTEIDAKSYISKICKNHRLPKGITQQSACVYMEPCMIKEGTVSFALFVPHIISEYIESFISDFEFYMQQLGVEGDSFNRMIDSLNIGSVLSEGHLYTERMKTYKDEAENNLGSIGFFLGLYFDKQSDKDEGQLYDFIDDDEIWINNGMLVGNGLAQFDGKGFSYWKNVKFKNFDECRDYIIGLEVELHKRAVQKWGINYLSNHLCFGTPFMYEGSGNYFLTYGNRPHITNTIWKYEDSQTDSLIFCSPIVNHKKLLELCVKYINSELVANEIKTIEIESPKVEQITYLDDSVKEQILAIRGRFLTAFMGKTIDNRQKDLFVKLSEDYSENVLLIGFNEQEQVTRTSMNMFLSLMMSAKQKRRDIAFKVIACQDIEDSDVSELLLEMESYGFCQIIGRRQRGRFLKELAKGVLEEKAEETILLILGQDRFRELKIDMELEYKDQGITFDEDNRNLFGGDGCSSGIRTYREALKIILDKGPDCGVHTLLQLVKVSNLLFEDEITPKMIYQKFKHLVLLKSDESTTLTLHLNDNIKLEEMSSNKEQLRAYYYAEESNSYTLFAPYMLPNPGDIINLLNSL